MNLHFRDWVLQSARLLNITVLISSIFLLLRGGFALESDSSAPDGVLSSALNRNISPMYLEKQSNPYALTQEEGWQLGGLNTNYANTGDAGTLDLRGGLFFSRATAARSLLDDQMPLPDGRFGNDGTADMRAQASKVNPLLMFGQQASDEQKTGRIAYQRLNYQTGGFRLSGSYADVGEDVQGLDALVRQLSGSDAEGAKLLGLGLTQTNYGLGFTSGGLSLNSSVSSLENHREGHGDFGLNRTTTTHSLGFAFGPRTQMQYSITSLVEEWDPSRKRTGKQVDTSALKLATGLGKQSSFSWGQSLTGTTAGDSTTDLRQRDWALKWADWKGLSLGANFLSKITEQTGAGSEVLNLDLKALLSSRMELTGKLVDNTTVRGKEQTDLENDTLDLRLVTKFSPTLQLVSQHKAQTQQSKTETVTTDHQLNWALSPAWNFTSRLIDTAISEETADKAVTRTEFVLAGKLNPAAQLNLFSRSDALPQDVQQDRQEITYLRQLGTDANAAKLQLQSGRYARVTPEITQSDELLTAQLLGLHPGKRTSLSLGYYQGPQLGAGYLTYRAWGMKPAGNLEVWRAEDFTAYHELGGELVQQLTDSTKVVYKQYTGGTAAGDQSMQEYGLEQRLGTVTLQTGERSTERPGKDASATTDEFWWRVAIPMKEALPAWTANALRTSVFQDGATWGFGTAPAWAVKPVHGLTVERTNALLGGKQTDRYAFELATMLDENLFLQTRYDRNPQKAGQPGQLEAMRRGLLYLAYAPQPKAQFFLRYVDEDRTAQQQSEIAYTLGFISQFSAVERLQLQWEERTRSDKGASLTGASYMIEYERTLSAEDSLSLKYRLNAHEFSSKPEDRAKLEVSYRHAF